MFKNLIRPLALILCLSFCLFLFPACQKADPLAQNGIVSLLVNAKTETVTATVTVNAKTLEAHKGETLALYELLPGETASAACEREPIATKKIGAKVSFQFDLQSGDASRLYSTFVVRLEDGSFLSQTGRRIENPQALANDTAPFAWNSNPKGLNAQNVDDAVSLGAMHTMYELSFSTFLGDRADSFSFLGAPYSYSEAALAGLDRRIRAASDAGMQISLTVTPDEMPSLLHAAAYLDFLAARYAGGAHGTVSAFFLATETFHTASDAASVALLANQALRSRVASGRVYVLSPSDTLAGSKAFFTDLQTAIAQRGSFEWGAAVAPVCTDAAWTLPMTVDTPLGVSTLEDLSTYLFSAPRAGRASYFAVTGLRFPATDPAMQAASLAYAYRASVQAKAGLIFYASQQNDLFGLSAAAGDRRPAASIFASLDTGLSTEQDAAVSELAGDAWKALSKGSPTRILKKGPASMGNSGHAEETLFDFSAGDTLGFTGVGSVTNPEIRKSAALSLPVLYTWLEPTVGNEAGVRRILSDGASLKGAMSLSVKMLSQAPEASNCRVCLSLLGTAQNGATLSYVSERTVPNGSWQTVTFQISNFVSAADLSAPCVLSVTCEPDVETDEEYVLWVRGINARYPENGSHTVLPTLLISLGAVLGFAGILVLYRHTQKSAFRRKR